MLLDVYFPDAVELLERAEGRELEMICKCIFNRFDCETCKSPGQSPMLGDDSIG